MNPAPIKPLITTSDLDKIDVRVGTILVVEDVAHSEKLVRLRVDFGDHARSILVGMKKERTSAKEIVCATQIVEFIGYKELNLARRVEEILVAQGYRTQASPFGNDGSVYILADGGLGPFGFALPRVAALVRPINQMLDPDVVELEAFKTLSGSENGLFASWLYFSDETKEEAGRLFNQAEFWDVGGIIRALTANYEKISDESRSYFPLKRIWILDRQKLD
jgi:predicted Mrr-cat superfamily restriction endonuclease